METETRTHVIMTCAVPGWHHWLEAPPEVSYLACTHRHLFTFKVRVLVGHDDRQVEFHLLRAQVLGLVRDRWPAPGWGADGHDFGSNSCEALARWLLGALLGTGLAVAAVECWEDDENGSSVEVA